MLYLAGTLLLVDQLADLTATLIANTPAPGTAAWRFGAFGLLTSRVSVFLLADVMLFAAAVGLAHRRVLRLLGVAHLMLVPLLLGGLTLFGLDWVQVRGQVSDRGSSRFDLAGIRAAALALLTTILAGWGGLTAFRAGRSHHNGSRDEAEVAPLLTGRRKGKAES